jgi:hypothetical protein
MTKLKSVEEELKLRKKAFKGVKIGSPVRFDYIFEWKDEFELARRFHEFRPAIIKSQSLHQETFIYFEIHKLEKTCRKSSGARLNKLHKEQVPDTTWNGESIF